MTYKTADLYDEFGDRVQVAGPVFRNYGGITSFYGPVLTLRVFEDNSLVREALESPGAGRVLVIDGGASLRCALVGDRLALLAKENGWAGIIVNGCIRDSADIAGISVGLKALNTNPRKSIKRGEGERGVKVHFAGLTFRTGDYIYADEDGLLLSEESLI